MLTFVEESDADEAFRKLNLMTTAVMVLMLFWTDDNEGQATVAPPTAAAEVLLESED
jgi:hypothetical protein